MLSERVVDVLYGWKICVATHGNLLAWKIIPVCLIWLIWRERNNRTFNCVELATMGLKNLFLRMLFEWFCTLGNIEEHSILDFIGSLSFRVIFYKV